MMSQSQSHLLSSLQLPSRTSPPTAIPRPQQWLLTTLAITFSASILYIWFMPNNLATALFLTREARTNLVKITRISHNEVETRVWRRGQ